MTAETVHHKLPSSQFYVGDAHTQHFTSAMLILSRTACLAPFLVHISNAKMAITTTALLALLLSRKRQSKSFRKRLTLEGRRRRDRRIRRRALQNPKLSTFTVLLGSGCDQSLITLTGFDNRTFYFLLERFEPYYNSFTPYSSDGSIKLLSCDGKGGRPRSMSAEQCLGLVFTWHRTRGAEFVLCMMFGITGSVCSMFLRFSRRLLLKVLKNESLAAVRMPTSSETQGYQEAFRSKYSMLKDVYCVADGLKLHLEQSGDYIIQNMFYNGWTHDHYVSNIFVFAPNGVVIACAINAPGAMHDSTVAEWGRIYEKLQVGFDQHGGRCVVDSAFCKSHYPFLLKSSQDCVVGSDGTRESIVTLRQATSARQASEWGMRAFQGTFPRLKDRFVYEERGERKAVLTCMVLLYNLRSRLVGINQILHSYMPHLSVEANHLLIE